jgi:formylglycine-generating enzyme required for sulfatase activity
MTSSELHPGLTLGDYVLQHPVAENATASLWMADQISIQRRVLLVVLLADEDRERFMGDMRLMASINHPIIGSVYEAKSDGHATYAAIEALPGQTLAQLFKDGQSFPALQLVRILQRISEGQIYYESSGLSSSSLSLSTVFIDDRGVVRLENRAQVGTRDGSRSAEDIAYLGQYLPGLVTPKSNGEGRVLTLLSWMRGEGLDRSLSWEEVLNYTIEIERQLTTPISEQIGDAPEVKSSNSLQITIAVVVLGVLGLGVWQHLRTKALESVPPLPPAVDFKAGSYKSADGESVTLPPFSLSSHEVTIAEYADFLKAYEAMSPAARGEVDAPDQPKDKVNHIPDDWQAMYDAARKREKWLNLPMRLDCPVVGVDWWDATAYCKWKAGKLPSAEQWFGGLSHQMADPSRLKAAPWGPVAEIPSIDVAPGNLLGMAGSVSEWTREPTINPANPLGSKAPMIIGGSYRNSPQGALSREWVKSLSIRRVDLGFRMAQ